MHKTRSTVVEIHILKVNSLQQLWFKYFKQILLDEQLN